MSNYRVLNSRGKEITTDVTLHPGEVLQMELQARGIRNYDFAESVGMKPSHFSELLHGKRHVSASLALKLEELLDISAEFWMRVQVYHDLFEARNAKTKKATRRLKTKPRQHT